MARSQARAKRPLTVELVGDRLVISIGIDTLAFAARHSDYANPWNDERNDFVSAFTITDERVFAHEVARALKDEEEDGSTLVHAMLDRAIENAVENGCDGVEIAPPPERAHE
jgi:hypothetical protein